MTDSRGRQRTPSPSIVSNASPSRQSPASFSGIPGGGAPAQASPSAPAAALNGDGHRSSAVCISSPSTSSIVVAVRKRPTLPHREQDENDIVRCSDEGNTVVVYEPRTKLDLTPIIEPSSFSFDHVFGEQSDNVTVYEDCCRPLLESVRDGGGAVIFAFGQTGSGKTYTMLGDRESPGLYGLAVTELLGMTGPGSGLSASFYEVYGTKLYDLLHDRTEVKMLQDEYKNIHIVGLTERDVRSVDDVNALMASGQMLRAIGTTHANDRSSRSHAVLEIKVKPTQQPAMGQSGGGVSESGNSFGRITFVDLAGSERASDTAETDLKTRREGAEINKSLLALKECIRAMSMRKRHIPFRGSKLTQILRESFTGRCRTCVIATISPCQSHCEDTLNTLRYADRIKELKGPVSAAGLEAPTPCRNCGLPIFVGDRHVCRRQVVECPHCRKEVDKNDLEQHISECREVPLRCPHCNERMLRADQQRHNRRCVRLPVRCTGCSQFVPRNVMDKHTMSECTGAKERCRHCNLLFSRQALAAHEPECDAKRLACPHCLKYIRKKRMDAHVAMCFLNPNRTHTVGGAGATPSATPLHVQGASSPGYVSPKRAGTRRRASDTSTLSRASATASASLHHLDEAAATSGGVATGSSPTPGAADTTSLLFAPPLLLPSATSPLQSALNSTAKYPRTSHSLSDPLPAAANASASRGNSANGHPSGASAARRVDVADRFPSVNGARRQQPQPPQQQQQQHVTNGEFHTVSSLEPGNSSTSGGGTSCPYARFGCPARITRQSLQAHLADSVAEHLRLVTTYADRVDTQNAELRRLVVTGNQ